MIANSQNTVSEETLLKQTSTKPWRDAHQEKLSQQKIKFREDIKNYLTWMFKFFKYPHCGHVDHADVNASFVIGLRHQGMIQFI